MLIESFWERNIINNIFCFLLQEATVEPSSSDEPILGNLDLAAMISIFGGAFFALVIGCICVCIFVRKMQKGDKEEATQPQQSFASFAQNSTVRKLLLNFMKSSLY